MYTSKNLVCLKDIETGEVTRFLPNTKFTLPNGEYVNQNEARLIGDDDTVVIIKAGETVKDAKPEGKAPIKKFNNQAVQETPKTKARRFPRKPAEPAKDILQGILDGD